MIELYKLTRIARVRLTGLPPETLLDRALCAGIPFSRVERTGSCSLEADLPARKLDALRKTTPEGSVTVLSVRGLTGKRLKKRLPLLVGTALTLGLLFVRSFYVSRLCVFGASDENSLREEALEARLTGWRPDVLERLDAFRDSLADDPRFSWSAVSLSGRTVEIRVREKTARPAAGEKGDLVAAKDARLENLIVLRGYPARENGDTVSEGTVLISADENGMAEGKAVASVWYHATERVPLTETAVRATGEKETVRLVRLLGFTAPETGENASAERSLYTGLPLRFIEREITKYENVRVTRTEDEVLSETGTALTQKLMLQLPSDALVTDSFVTFRREGDEVIVSACVKTTENIAVR